MVIQDLQHANQTTIKLSPDFASPIPALALAQIAADQLHRVLNSPIHHR